MIGNLALVGDNMILIDQAKTMEKFVKMIKPMIAKLGTMFVSFQLCRVHRKLRSAVRSDACKKAESLSQ